MKDRALRCLLGLSGAAFVVGAQHAAPLHFVLGAPPQLRARASAPAADTERAVISALTARDSALHALNRLAYGPRPGDIERVAALGVMKWIDRQLKPDKIDDGLLAAREHQFTLLDYDRGKLARLYVEMQRERRDRKRDAREPGDDVLPRQLVERGAESLPPRAPHRGAELGTRNAEQSDPRSFRVPTSAFPVGAQRELRPRAARAPHARRGRRLHPRGRDQRRPDLHGLEHRATAPGRRLPVPRLGARRGREGGVGCHVSGWPRNG